MNDLISRHIIKEQMLKYGFTAPDMTVTEFVEDCLPSAQLEKKYTKADYIMNLHKQYGCTFIRAEEAHQKALEYLRNQSTLKG